MFSILLSLLLSTTLADVPKINLGPDAIHQAKALLSPIDHVTVFSDRAQVHRKTKQYFSAGIHTIRLDNIPNTAQLDSLRISSKQAKIIRIQPQRIESNEYSLEELQEIIEQMEELQNELTLLQTEKNLLTQEIQQLRSFRPARPISENDREANEAYSVQSWKTALHFMQNRQIQLNQDLEKINTIYNTKYEKWSELQKKAQPFLQGNYSQQRVDLIVVIDVPKEKMVYLDIEYFISGASWFPTYDVHFDSKTDSVQIQTAAYVQQSTGENWNDAKISLSTSMPNLALEMPSLLTWTLGEKNEYIPHPRMARSTNRPPAFPPPIQQQTLLEIEEATKREAYWEQQQYLVQLNNQLSNQSPRNTAVGIGYAEQTIVSGYAGGKGGAAYGSVAGSVGSVHSYDMTTAMKTPALDDGIYYEMAEESVSLERDTSRLAKKSMARSTATLSSGSVASYQNMNLAIEAPNAYRVGYYPNPNLPHALAKGLDYRWDAIGEFSIPSNQQQIKIPLLSKQHQATSFYETTPALEEMAYLKANVKNTDDQAILQGSANIFLNKRYSSQALLRTTEPSASLDLPLGADENIRIKRNITPQQRKEGVLKQNETTDYSIKIEIGNYKDKPIQIRVFDILPKTNNTEIEIEYLTSSHQFTSETNANGVLYWDVDIPAGKTETITLSYSITRPKNWKLWGN